MGICVVCDNFESVEEVFFYLERYGNMTPVENMKRPSNRVRIFLGQVTKAFDLSDDRQRIVLLMKQINLQGIDNDEMRVVVAGPLARAFDQNNVQPNHLIALVNPKPFRCPGYQCLSVSPEMNVAWIFLNMRLPVQLASTNPIASVAAVPDAQIESNMRLPLQLTSTSPTASLAVVADAQIESADDSFTTVRNMDSFSMESQEETSPAPHSRPRPTRATRATEKADAPGPDTRQSSSAAPEESSTQVEYERVQHCSSCSSASSLSTSKGKLSKCDPPYVEEIESSSDDSIVLLGARGLPVRKSTRSCHSTPITSVPSPRRRQGLREGLRSYSPSSEQPSVSSVNFKKFVRPTRRTQIIEENPSPPPSPPAGRVNRSLRLRSSPRLRERPIKRKRLLRSRAVESYFSSTAVSENESDSEEAVNKSRQSRDKNARGLSFQKSASFGDSNPSPPASSLRRRGLRKRHRSHEPTERRALRIVDSPSATSSASESRVENRSLRLRSGTKRGEWSRKRKRLLRPRALESYFSPGESDDSSSSDSEPKELAKSRRSSPRISRKGCF